MFFTPFSTYFSHSLKHGVVLSGAPPPPKKIKQFSCGWLRNYENATYFKEIMLFTVIYFRVQIFKYIFPSFALNEKRSMYLLFSNSVHVQIESFCTFIKASLVRCPKYIPNLRVFYKNFFCTSRVFIQCKTIKCECAKFSKIYMYVRRKRRSLQLQK